MLKSLQNLIVRKFGCVGQSISGESPPAYTGPLDLVPGAVVAYGQRAMSAAMLGQPYATIKKDGGASEQFLFNASTGIPPTADIATFLGASDGFIETWNDGSGNGHNLSQSDALYKPLYSASSFGDVPAFSSASTAYLRSGASISFAGPFTIFAVVNVTDASAFCGANFSTFSGDGAAFAARITQLDATTGRIAYSSTSNGTNFCDLNYLQEAEPPTNFQGARLWVGKFFGSTAVIESNGTAVSVTQEESAEPGAIAHEFFAMSYGNDEDGGNFFVGKMAELIVYPSLLSSENIDIVSQNIATYYGITLP